MADSILQHPFFGLTLSVVIYAFANLIQERWRFMHPLFVCTGLIILILVGFRIPFAYFKEGADVLTLLLGPATVALGVPLYKYRSLIRANLKRVMVSVISGSIVGIGASAAIVGLLGGSRSIVLSMLPKSVSSPIAIEIANRLGGIPELTAVLTTMTGLVGSMFGVRLLQWFKIQDDISIGIALGTAAHGIGTAKVIKDSERQGSFAGLSMALCGIMTSIFFIPLYWWLQ
ncbi:LrgB family protein [Paenibacillus sp. GCM10023248]|uniref:LrgB family protein n=1 Tax=Bacillales TaxID=1385 RepID=UPI002379F982|nr:MULTISPECIES: LrgB family protein [Bacillales]MDD9267814.1 LrgB family protein [Paenibacillus sp. MAHUQ-63]MDR6882276.1 putative murein hydrolase (TIGR00659 family) [Bacillus sp. 3255]